MHQDCSQASVTRNSIVSGFAKTCSSELEQIQISSGASSLETNLGSTTRKPRGTASSGRPQIHHDSRKTKIKTMLITFFDQKGLVHHEFVPQGQTVNQHFYQQVLNRLNDRVRRCRPALGKTSPECSIMTMRLHTLRSACGSCRPTSRSQCLTTLLTRQTSLRATSGSSLNSSK